MGFFSGVNVKGKALQVFVGLIGASEVRADNVDLNSGG